MIVINSYYETVGTRYIMHMVSFGTNPFELIHSLTGIGFAMTSVTFILSMYYNIIVAYAIYYFFASMTDELPWTDCE